MEKEVLDLFKVMVVEDSQRLTIPDMTHLNRGVVTDFKPTSSQLRVLADAFAPLPAKTLFGREERETKSMFELITKQCLSYFETLAIRQPGLFNLEFEGGELFTLNYIRGVSRDELGNMVRALLYRNAPVKDAVVIKNIVDYYEVEFGINRVVNNELRCLLYKVGRDKFVSGDDAVRYIVYRATEQTLLIKSKEVDESVRTFAQRIDVKFLEDHILPLAQVFNRHKRLIMALKRPSTRAVINKISRLSKTKHVPIHESIAKTFISKALSGEIDDMAEVLSKVSIRDKFKYLGVLAFKRERMTTDAFVVRNGKVHFEENRKVYDKTTISIVENEVITSLGNDLAALRGKKILLDKAVRYGLPTSRKQTVGRLPFGTRVKVDTDRISSGIYWENGWGATDLDLSTIDTSGNRTGWGCYSGYNSQDIIFSGDMTWAENGAMEFMTSGKGSEYGLFVNIYSGNTGCGAEIVVGTDTYKKKSSNRRFGRSTDNTWIENVILREKITLNSRGSAIGFVKGSEFIVFNGRLGNRRVSGSVKNPMVVRGMAETVTVNDLFDLLGIEYDTERQDGVSYDHDVSYDGFSYDKLEGMLL